MNAIQPRSVTLLSWLFILSGILGVGFLLWFQLTPESDNALPFELTSTVIVLSWLSSFVYLASGVYLLYGHNHGRHLLWLGLLPAIIVTIVTARRWDASLISVGLFLITIWPLFTPTASRYFLRQQTERDLLTLSQRDSSDLALWRKIVGIPLFVISGFLIYLISFMAFLNVYGQYGILVEALLMYALPWLVVHAAALFIYQAPSRYLASGVTFIGGVGFTAFLIWVVFNYPLPEIEGSDDIKEAFSGIASGLFVSSLFFILGVVQLAVHFITNSRFNVKR